MHWLEKEKRCWGLLTLVSIIPLFDSAHRGLNSSAWWEKGATIPHVYFLLSLSTLAVTKPMRKMATNCR